MKAHYITSRVAIFIAAITFMFNQVCEAGPSGPIFKNNNNRTQTSKVSNNNVTKGPNVKVSLKRSPGSVVTVDARQTVVNNNVTHVVQSAPNITMLAAQSSATRQTPRCQGSCKPPTPRYEDYYPAPVQRQAPPVCYQQPVQQIAPPRQVAYQQPCAQPQQIRPSAPRFVMQAPAYNGSCPPGQQVQTGWAVTRRNDRTGEIVSQGFTTTNPQTGESIEQRGYGGGGYQQRPQYYGNYGGGGGNYQQPHNYGNNYSGGGYNYGNGYNQGQNPGVNFGDNVQYNSSAPVNYRSGGNPNQWARDMALQYGR